MIQHRKTTCSKEQAGFQNKVKIIKIFNYCSSSKVIMDPCSLALFLGFLHLLKGTETVAPWEQPGSSLTRGLTGDSGDWQNCRRDFMLLATWPDVALLISSPLPQLLSLLLQDAT